MFWTTSDIKTEKNLNTHGHLQQHLANLVFSVTPPQNCGEANFNGNWTLNSHLNFSFSFRLNDSKGKNKNVCLGYVIDYYAAILKIFFLKTILKYICQFSVFINWYNLLELFKEVLSKDVKNLCFSNFLYFFHSYNT